MGEIKLNGSKVFFNSLVENAEKYFSANTKPIEAEIIDASFERNGEEEYVIEGLWNYYDKQRHIPPSTPEDRYIHHKYSNIVLYLQIREKESRKHATLKLDNLDDIMAHLMENGKDELKEIENSSNKMSKDEKEIEKERIYLLRNSCLPLIKRPANIYRQAVNGQDVIGFSKVYPAIKIESCSKNTKSNSEYEK